MTSSFRHTAIAHRHQQPLLTHSRKLTGSKVLTKIIRSNAKSVLLIITKQFTFELFSEFAVSAKKSCRFMRTFSVLWKSQIKNHIYQVFTM